MYFYIQSKLDDIVKEMKSLGEVLVPFNYPLKPISSWEDDLAIFKMREVTIDGYQIFIHYQKSDYTEYLIETLQIHNMKHPFLPFYIVSKLGKRFFGKDYLSLIEIYKEHRKIYIWSVCSDRNGNKVPIPNQTDTEMCEFEGLQYLYMQPKNIDFF
jgi:hypothetical protein